MTGNRTIKKIKALIDGASTTGEQAAAVAALERVEPKVPAILPEREPLSDAIVKKLPLPTKGNKVFWDTVVAGFGIRITAGDARAFVLDYRVRGSGRRRRYTIGSFPNWTTGAARIRARELRRRVDAGEDPMADLEEARAAPTMVELCDRFVAEHLPRRRDGTIKAYTLALNKYIRPYFGAHTKVADVAFADIDALHRKVTTAGGPYAANLTIRILSKMFSLAIKWEMRTDNPVKGVERNLEIKRKRYLSSDGSELARLTKALTKYPDQQVANIIRLLLLTGGRKSEILSMRWSGIDLATGIWTKLAATTKQKGDHVIPLSAPALQLLNDICTQQTVNGQTLGTFVFPSNGVTGHVIAVDKAWKTLCRNAKITGLRIHDLRHSFASQLASGGASLSLIGSLLGHTQASTTARYMHLYQDPQRAAVEQVGDAVVAAGKSAEKRGE
jgi:integrase